MPDTGVENARVGIEEMSTIFSADNFPSLTHSEEKLGRNEKDADLDIGIVCLLLSLFSSFTSSIKQKYLATT